MSSDSFKKLRNYLRVIKHTKCIRNAALYKFMTDIDNECVPILKFTGLKYADIKCRFPGTNARQLALTWQPFCAPLVWSGLHVITQ